MNELGVLILVFCLKPVFGFINLHKNSEYYVKQKFLCIMHCNVRTCKAVSTLTCSFSRFSLNEGMNIVYIVFYRKNCIN